MEMREGFKEKMEFSIKGPGPAITNLVAFSSLAGPKNRPSEANFRGPLIEKGPPGSLHGTN